MFYKVENRECLAFEWVNYKIKANTLNQAIREAKRTFQGEDVIVYTLKGKIAYQSGPNLSFATSLRSFF